MPEMIAASRLSRPLFGAVMAVALATPMVLRAQTIVDTAPPPTSTLAAVTQSSATPSGTAAPATASTEPSSSALSQICSDRPTKSNSACTVDVGHLQYETDLVNASFQRLDGVTTDTYFIINPTLKYGLTSNVDVEANISPAEIVRTRDESGDDRTLAGVSDLYLRVKYEFLNLQGGNLEATILPYVKAPIARPGIGNGVVEGGAILPVNYKLTSILTLAIDPEVDFYKDSVGDGLHVNMAQLVDISVNLPKNFTLYGELWGDWNFDPAGAVNQYSADVALSYLINKYLQLDTGFNFGLNKYTPGVQAYVGVSQKF